ncbi:N-acetylmuramic acid 6-phosphate etherase [Myceligenerans pegani]|uniref:N-acetylmuramic acid 6-phosphate etherase n=1 Tax=Myceligenerans pegani TaxID=2776917 RepID=A0ABR9N4C1_9MICO|nr:N-acetylmuramic acid 6-phosphate etherase [Myceligenerans sp. TRM 65318]MBE1878016.1 N-acetylmuramic acid 6-phosphate etherase [Myceligenerans sp. TRM 65318]MBE3020287.1 N-acetylmuramic acid 6-phosphate etherase [Myceligenerans sp. TRM 65318]
MITDTGYERAGSVPPVRVSSPTEERNPRTRDIDVVPTAELVAMISDEDARVVDAVRAQHPQIVAAVDIAVEAILAGGRVHYVGSGTSGRMAFMDAAELLPTFGVGEEMFVAHIAGGPGAFARAVEGAEDDAGAGRALLDDASPRDVVVGIAASGRTPYVRGALEAARELGAATVLLASNPLAPLTPLADVAILVDTGAEAITGSTRMKAGTAQKLVLNTLSTAVMVRLGKTYSNFMVEVVATNEKLRGRLVRLLEQATGHETEVCEKALRDTGGDLRVALVTLLVGVDEAAARAALAAPGVLGVRGAIDRLR